MSSPIDKRELEHLAKLARIEIDPKEETKLLADIRGIVEYVSELQKLDTSGVEPMSGGGKLMSVFRGDAERENTNQGAGRESFPETENGYLKVPPVFDEARPEGRQVFE